jgi:hypothetical protein
VVAEAPSRSTTTAPRSGFRTRAPEFLLRLDAMELAIDRPRLVIGRSSTADIQLDSLAVSRHHAAITIQGRQLLLEDLGSRNGVFVNGVPIQQPLPLEHGDRVRIGDHELEVVFRGEGPVLPLELEDIHDDDDLATTRMDAFQVIGPIVDGVLDEGDTAEAEALISGHLRVLLREAQGGGPATPASVEAASRYALRLAEATRRGVWVDYVLDLHFHAQRLLSSTTIRELFRIAPVTRYQDRAALRRYLELVASRGVSLGSDAPVVLERLTRYGRL